MSKDYEQLTWGQWLHELHNRWVDIAMDVENNMILYKWKMNDDDKELLVTLLEKMPYKFDLENIVISEATEEEKDGYDFV